MVVVHGTRFEEELQVGVAFAVSQSVVMMSRSAAFRLCLSANAPSRLIALLQFFNPCLGHLLIKIIQNYIYL